MNSHDVLALVREQNRGRDASLIARKENLLAQDPFTFLRGTALLFWKRVSLLAEPEAPAIWGCGDLHVQNLGTFKGSNRLVYFDINDFDEACLLPASWEVVRMLVSLRLCGGSSRAFAQRWLATLVSGKAFWIERELAKGPVRGLMESLEARSRKEFLDKRSRKTGGRRTLICDGDRALRATAHEVEVVRAAVEGSSLAASRPGFYKVVDVARRVAGNGSLGVERYIVLVEGKGSPDGNHILDMKASAVSTAAAFSPCRQPLWPAENVRIVTLQERLQAVSPAHLEALMLGGRPFVLKALQPVEDKVGWNPVLHDPDALGMLVHDMADVVAWSSIRSSGRQGSATADELIAWAQIPGVVEQLENLTDQLEKEMREDWKLFVEAREKGSQ